MLGVSLGGYQGSTIVNNFLAMFTIFLHRTFLRTQDDSGVTFTRLQQISKFLQVNVWGFTLLVPLLAACGLLLWMKRDTRAPLTYAGRVNGMLSVMGVVWVLLMAQGVYVHMYYQYFLLPGEVFFASVLLDRVHSLERRFRWLSGLSVTIIILAVYYLSRLTIFGAFL